MPATPPAEFVIDEPLIRQLLVEQAPELADLELRLVASGWDNEMWRLGPDLVVRLPRRALAEELLVHEQRWLPELAPRLPVPIPVPIVAGRPTRAHPRPWSVVPWLPGEPLATTPGTARIADELAAFLDALHRPAPPQAPVNDWRGVPLATRAGRAVAAIDALAEAGEPVLADRLRRRWSDLVTASDHTGPAVWLHGDLHPLNVLAVDGALSAVIDFGDLTSGDPASDLAVAWMAFEGPERARFMAQLPGVDPETWRRAQGWALAIAALVLQNTDDDPVLAATARTALDRVLSSSVPRSA